MANVDAHIKFDGVEGESTHADHKGEIELLSWAWGVSNQSMTAGGGSGTGKAVGGDLSFTHRYDKASPVLAKKCVQGMHFKEVTITARKSGEGQKDFWKCKMTEVFITSLSLGGGQGGEITENVGMSYGSIDFSYKPQDDKGVLGGEVKFGWNTKTTVVT
jgi:type VI secretion system secreted protein Hcp